MAFADTTPLLPGETIMSWVARIAREQAGMAPFDYLNFIEFGRKDLLEATPAGLARLARISGAPIEEIADGAYVRIADRLYEHRRQPFHAEFAGRERTTFCPACLLEDARPDSRSRGLRVGRVNWLFSPFRTCLAHRIPLSRTVHQSYAERFQDMALVAPDNGALARLVDNAETRQVSPLQLYVEDRLGGSSGPAWLDGQQIDLGTRASEMIGACLLFGAKADLPTLSEDQWDAAGAAGFEVAARGEGGIRSALEEMLHRGRRDEVKGGPQAAFGRLFQWLQFNRSSKSRGPIREVLREFILDSMAIEPGTRLLGEVVETRRRHSVASLAKLKKLHRRTLNRALVLTGLMPDGDPGEVEALLSVDAVAGELLADRMHASIPVIKMPTYLNCNRRQAELLVQHGLVSRLGGGNADTILNMVPVADLDAFIARMRRRGVPVDRPGDGMVNVIVASEVVRWPVNDIVRIVLDYDISKIELLSADLKFKSVLVDPAEVCHGIEALQAKGRLSVTEVAKRLKTEPWCVRSLASNHDRNGRPFLPAFLEKNTKGAARAYFEIDDVASFESTHVDLKDLAEARGSTAKILRKQLSGAGIEPILPRPKLNRLVYRRADV